MEPGAGKVLEVFRHQFDPLKAARDALAGNDRRNAEIRWIRPAHRAACPFQLTRCTWRILFETRYKGFAQHVNV